MSLHQLMHIDAIVSNGGEKFELKDEGGYLLVANDGHPAVKKFPREWTKVHDLEKYAGYVRINCRERFYNYLRNLTTV
ncbi:MAG: hypothetical protein KGJ58_04135 [Patescibacteria group bacterium]|nr:hypothetical protein [Patescibacteria group bacterium]MDE2218610.1 hypothetical protein [Patescibacteria group bacterium]